MHPDAQRVSSDVPSVSSLQDVSPEKTVLEGAVSSNPASHQGATTVRNGPDIVGEGNYIGEDGKAYHYNRMNVQTHYDQSKVQTNEDLSHVFDGIDIKDPVELLFLVDDDIQSGRVKLHGWQIQFMMDFAHDGNTKDHPFQAEVCAANGSGKDKYILAACIVWLCMRYKSATGVATNGSGVQLDNQTEFHIRNLCNKVNLKLGMTVWKCNYRDYTCLVTNSVIFLFATDEPNKAEGFHPAEAGAKLAIFASEAKAIPDSIFGALARCLGVTHRIDVSSPGLPMGHFFNRFQTAIDRKEVKNVKDCPPVECLKYHITAYQCSHITPEEIENFARNLPGGKSSPVFRSGILAEFGTTDEMVVIPYTYVWKATTPSEKCPWIPEAYNKGGLDLSDGGDETVLTVRNGNKHIKTIPFKFDNTQDTIDFLKEKFKEYGLCHPEALIYADCGGLGKPMLDQLRRQGWENIRYVDNRSTPYYPKTYLNRGAEVWFHTRILMERNELIVLRDEKLVRQLSTRYYKIDTKNRHQLLSKLEMRSRGYPSPDRADSFVLSFWDYKSTKPPIDVRTLKEDEAKKIRPFGAPTPPKPVGTFSLKSSARNSNSQSLQQFRRTLRKQQDFSLLQEEVDNLNKMRMVNQQTVEQPTE